MKRIQSLTEAVQCLDILAQNIEYIKGKVQQMPVNSIYATDVYRAVDVAGLALAITKAIAEDDVLNAYKFMVGIERLIKLEA